MSEGPSVDGRRTAGRFVAAVLASLVGVLGAASPRTVAAQQSVPVPDFTIDSKSAWLMVGDAWVVEEMRKANDWVLAGKIPFRARERCYPAGVPGWVIYTLAEPISILQTDKQVTMINHGGPEVRRIYLDVPHSANPKPSWYGESVGHYEGGDTLVVDTISTKTFIDNYRTPHTDQLHVIERYKLIDGGKMMEVMISVDDPGAFTTPWLAMQRFRRVQREWTEDICAENNFDFLQYEVAPLPQAAKPDF